MKKTAYYGVLRCKLWQTKSVSAHIWKWISCIKNILSWNKVNSSILDANQSYVTAVYIAIQCTLFCVAISTRKLMLHAAFPNFHFSEHPICLDGVCVCVFVRERVPALTFIANWKLYWTMIKCSLPQELIMSNFLSRPSWDHFSGPPWLSGAPWTSRDMRPQWLSPPIPMKPSKAVQAGSRTDVPFSAAEDGTSSPFLTASSAVVYWTDSTDCFCSLYHNIWVSQVVLFFSLLLVSGLFWMQQKAFFFCDAVLLSYFLFSHPLLWCNAFLVNSHYVIQDHEMTLFHCVQSCLITWS